MGLSAVMGTTQGDQISMNPKHVSQECPGGSQQQLRMPWSGFPKLQARRLGSQGRGKGSASDPARRRSSVLQGERTRHSLALVKEPRRVTSPVLYRLSEEPGQPSTGGRPLQKPQTRDGRAIRLGPSLRTGRRSPVFYFGS